MFWNFRSMMAATVSSCGLIKVGPNTTPKFATVIRFLLACFETLFEKNWRKKQEIGYENFPLLLETAVYFTNENITFP